MEDKINRARKICEKHDLRLVHVMDPDSVSYEVWAKGDSDSITDDSGSYSTFKYAAGNIQEVLEYLDEKYEKKPNAKFNIIRYEDGFATNGHRIEGDFAIIPLDTLPRCHYKYANYVVVDGKVTKNRWGDTDD